MNISKKEYLGLFVTMAAMYSNKQGIATYKHLLREVENDLGLILDYHKIVVEQEISPGIKMPVQPQPSDNVITIGNKTYKVDEEVKQAAKIYREATKPAVKVKNETQKEVKEVKEKPTESPEVPKKRRGRGPAKKDKKS